VASSIVREDQIDKAALLRRVSLFEGMDEEAVARLARLARVAFYPPGSEIIEEGADFDEEADGMFLLVEGAVEVRHGSTDGHDGHLFARLERGDFFGELSLLDGQPRSASVFAVDEVLCMVLHRWDFLRELRKDARIAERMLVELAGRLRALEAETAEAQRR
jgi:CRP/FNR family cyclic AMP-dependent transcriptional regulator